MNQAGGVMLNSQLEQEDIKEIQKIQPRSVIYIELVLCHFVMASADWAVTFQILLHTRKSFIIQRNMPRNSFAKTNFLQ